jgi:release factor glutamine methyltransferase
VGVDLSAEALELARLNARRNGVGSRIHWHHGNLLEGLEGASFDVVVANLPYVPTARWHELPRHIRDREPRSALDGGTDGLDIISRLVENAREFLAQEGYLYLEIGDEQDRAVTGLMKRHKFMGVQTVKDLTGRARVVFGHV